MNLRCMIIDDEPNAVSLLEVLIGETTQWSLLAKCYNAIEALEFLKSNALDFIFLDINMPQLSGMELAGLLPKPVKIVFTTAYAEHAAESYNFNTIDYLLKPVTLKRFLASVQKIEAAFALSLPPEKATTSFDDNEYFFVKSGKTLKKLLLADIYYFEGEREYVRIVTGEEEILVYRRLKEIEEQLSPPFLRVHKSYIVNMKRAKQVLDNHVYIENKQIPVSDNFRAAFMEFINQKLF